MSVLRSHASCLLVFSALLASCSSTQQRPEEPSPARFEGTSTIAQAAQEVGAGRYGVADRILADYATRYPQTAEATDATYWRALYKLDPANPNAAPREALILLDSCLASATGTHRVEAQMLRRLAASMDARAVAAAMPSALTKPDVPKAEDKAKDEEMQRLKEELAKANAELERIKRRLAQPKP